MRREWFSPRTTQAAGMKVYINTTQYVCCFFSAYPSAEYSTAVMKCLNVVAEVMDLPGRRRTGRELPLSELPFPFSGFAPVSSVPPAMFYGNVPATTANYGFPTFSGSQVPFANRSIGEVYAPCYNYAPAAYNYWAPYEVAPRAFVGEPFMSGNHALGG
ncbi:uncharacterized protein BT62DRAFT_1012469 [Guyanagaster necrorhizus]|uniref:Uncharacterized protein n=1 Tax=Guyanagaster necrorhizus TaxID=856835 RepID=A0A9P7VHK7_9AGAR|nr:uncharacterized protein BT62DRAFT_1012469 [Guyanagaster necrorhizus MCA 3950]KAG7440695.1 hypothetical protein BT62DRAFT_1012469 [Guyanagaster necrorhizus MCA 3950]